MKSIQNCVIKIKQLGATREFVITLLILLVGLGSFGLGRLSKIEEVREPVRIDYGTQNQMGAEESVAAAVSLSVPETQKLFVASKNGNKYHHPWCSGAQRISEANKIWFDSKEEAENAGFTPAANCKGL